MGIKFCPNCEGEEIMLAAGGITGGFVCKDCGFRGAVFPEKIINKKTAETGKGKK